jgi:hypothetical protein
MILINKIFYTKHIMKFIFNYFEITFKTNNENILNEICITKFIIHSHNL